MTDLIVVCPSYRRPDQARELYASFRATSRADSRLRFGVWNQDPRAGLYLGLPVSSLTHELMTPRTNALALWAAEFARYVGWVADDMRFRTEGWDNVVIQTLDEMGGGVVFGNDLRSPGDKPSHVFMSAEVVRTLGWLVHPDMTGTFFDDVWEHLGRGLGKYRYLPEITVEHLYTEKDNADTFLHDLGVFNQWLREDMDDQIAMCKRALRRRDALASAPTPAGVSV